MRHRTPVIAFKHMALKIMIGPYQSQRLTIKFMLIRCTFFCYVLDYFAYQRSLGQNVCISEERIKDGFFKNTPFRRCKTNESIADTSLINMVMLGLIYRGNESICWTPTGINAYTSQKYHSQLASLNEAQASRRIAITAVIIAITSLLATLITTQI